MFATVVADLLRRGARVRFRAPGSSMVPTINDGDTITVEPVSAGRLRRGDVVLVRRSTAIIAHRLVGRRHRPDGGIDFLLRGDAADGDDAPVPAIDVLGRVVEADRNGVRARPSSWTARLAALARWGARRLWR
jgi:signal peptidase I